MRFSFGGLAAIDVTDRVARILGFVTEAREAGTKSAGNTTNPAANAILADSGALANAGIYRVTVTVATSVTFNPAVMQIQHRDAANAVTNVALGVAQGATTFSTLLFFLTLVANERVRVTNITALVGDVHAAVSYERIS